MSSRTTLASLTLILIIFNLQFTLFTKIAIATCGCTTPSPPKPTLPSPASPPAAAKCPRDALKLGVCANVLNGLLNVTLGQPPVEPCCTLIKGLADLEAAACLCTALKANVLGNNLNVPISLTLLLNVCSKQVPPGFQC